MTRIDERYRKLTLLHSNDMHGDFLAENVDNKLVGGVSMLSGYISKVKAEEENVLYCVAGDMFRGSVIDSEYKGVSTIEIMNMLSPDVVTIGNHETDYGLSHLLFIEKCAKFPIINANLYIKMNGSRLFKPYHIAEIGGMKVLFIGIITEEVMTSAKNESVIGTLVDVNDAAKEVEKICNTFNGIDIDFTVLLTHIGFDKDVELAKILPKELGVDVIIGGHSHTFMKEPKKVNDILIVQAGTGTDQIGRFDIVVDTLTNSVASYKWQAVDINKDNCPTDEKLEELVSGLKTKTEIKYGRVLRRLKCELKHDNRYRQSELGSFVADVFKKATGVDLMFLTGGSLRVNKIEPIVTLLDVMSAYPFTYELHSFVATGKQLKEIFNFFYKQYVLQTGEFYNISSGFNVEYDEKTNTISKLLYNGKELNDNDKFTCGCSHYDFNNFEDFFGVSFDKILENGECKILASNISDVLIEYLGSNEELPEYPINNRVIVK